MRHIFSMAAVVCAFANTALAETIDTSEGPMTAEMRIDGLETPWAFDFLPDGAILVSERPGRLWYYPRGGAGGRLPVSGLPKLVADGQGGLLDIMVPRDFATSREIYLTFAKPQFFRKSGTALYRAKLSEDGTSLQDGEVIFEISRGTGGGFHFGSRVVEAPDGSLFMTIGDRGNGDLAQDLSMHNGTVVRVHRDGSVPDDNPFVDTRGALPEIWSYGHRNAQGAAIDPTGQLWVVEHGAQGGDEINRVTPGANYGWPVISYGRNYDGSKIGEGTAKDGMAQPEFYWDPSIAPSGMVFHDGTGDGLPNGWENNAFVGSLKFDYIARLSGDPLVEVEKIQGASTDRVRDLGLGPEGHLWFLSVGNGALYRLNPAPQS